MKFDRYRAYAEATGTKKGVEVDPVTLKARRVKQTYAIDEVAFEGKADANGEAATFDAGDAVVTRVVFLAGKKDDETVAGSVDVHASGEIVAVCPEPEAAPDPDELV